MSETIISMKMSEMSLEQLEQLTQGLGHQIEKLRAQRMHVRGLMQQRLRERQVAELQAQIDAINGTAPGAELTAGASQE